MAGLLNPKIKSSQEKRIKWSEWSSWRIDKKEQETTEKEDPTYENNENLENSINFIATGTYWNRRKTIIDNAFVYKVAIDVLSNNEDLELKSVEECRYRKDWPKWKDVIQLELNSFENHEVFRPTVQTLEGVKPIGFRWIFVWKHNKNNEIVINHDL